MACTFHPTPGCCHLPFPYTRVWVSLTELFSFGSLQFISLHFQSAVITLALKEMSPKLLSYMTFTNCQYVLQVLFAEL